jgi:hypothetical protein
MLEFYWAYVDYQKLMSFTEELLSTVARHICSRMIVSQKLCGRCRWTGQLVADELCQPSDACGKGAVPSNERRHFSGDKRRA